jgi:hypothetical protein
LSEFGFGFVLEAYEIHYKFQISETRKMKFDEKLFVLLSFKHSKTLKHFGPKFLVLISTFSLQQKNNYDMFKKLKFSKVNQDRFFDIGSLNTKKLL